MYWERDENPDLLIISVCILTRYLHCWTYFYQLYSSLSTSSRLTTYMQKWYDFYEGNNSRNSVRVKILWHIRFPLPQKSNSVWGFRGDRFLLYLSMRYQRLIANKWNALVFQLKLFVYLMNQIDKVRFENCYIVNNFNKQCAHLPQFCTIKRSSFLFSVSWSYLSSSFLLCLIQYSILCGKNAVKANVSHDMQYFPY
jgi:hypothetical protein